MIVTKQLIDERTRWVVSQCSGTILDIGGNQGHVFRGTGLQVTLLDINEFEPCEFPQIVADAHCLPFADNSFDITCLNEILEHVHNPILVLREAARVARRKVVFTVPNEYGWKPEFKPFTTLSDRLVENEGASAEDIVLPGNPTLTKLRDFGQMYHNRWYTREMLELQLKYVGLPYQIETTSNITDSYSWFCGIIKKVEDA